MKRPEDEYLTGANDDDNDPVCSLVSGRSIHWLLIDAAHEDDGVVRKKRNVDPADIHTRGRDKKKTEGSK